MKQKTEKLDDWDFMYAFVVSKKPLKPYVFWKIYENMKGCIVFFPKNLKGGKKRRKWWKKTKKK